MHQLKIRGQVSNEQEKLLTEKVREIDEMRQVNDNNKKSMSDVKYEVRSVACSCVVYSVVNIFTHYYHVYSEP